MSDDARQTDHREPKQGKERLTTADLVHPRPEWNPEKSLAQVRRREEHAQHRS